MNIHFTKHAESKFDVLESQKFPVSRDQVEKVLRKPDSTDKGYGGTLIAQKGLGDEYLLRVVFRKQNGKIIVITFYPARKNRYTNKA